MYVLFEGIDGAGKSTLLHKVYRNLRREGIRSIVVKEPSVEPPPFNDPFDEVMWYYRDRLSLQPIIDFLVKEGWVVLSDRSWLSSLVYQGLHYDEERIIKLHSNVRKPDLLVLVTRDPKEAWFHLSQHDKETFSVQDLEVLQQRYLNKIEQPPWNLVDTLIINVSTSTDPLPLILKKLLPTH